MSEKTYFNLTVNGLGYVNRIREVSPKKGQPFLCCDIAALRGEADNVDYTWFDCRVTGTQAQQLILRCREATTENRKVLLHFRLGDLYAETFTYKKAERQGETGVSLKAHLLFISMISIDGEQIYKAETSKDATPAEDLTPLV